MIYVFQAFLSLKAREINFRDKYISLNRIIAMMMMPSLLLWHKPNEGCRISERVSYVNDE